MLVCPECNRPYYRPDPWRPEIMVANCECRAETVKVVYEFAKSQRQTDFPVGCEWRFNGESWEAL